MGVAGRLAAAKEGHVRDFHLGTIWDGDFQGGSISNSGHEAGYKFIDHVPWHSLSIFHSKI